MVTISSKIAVILIVFNLLVTLNVIEGYCITIQEELQLSKEIIQIIENDNILVHDDISLNYINKIGNRITTNIPNNVYNYTFHILKDSRINAFAIPFGHVFINTGLIKLLKSEEELASVLAHEIAHINCRHISKSIEESSKIDLLSLAPILASILITKYNPSPNIWKAAAIASASIKDITTKAYSRDNERQADLVAMCYLQIAGYSGEGMLTFLKTIQNSQFTSSNQNLATTYLSTHPAFEERLESVDIWLQNNKLDIIKIIEPNSKDFELFRIRMVALYDNETLALNNFKIALKNDPKNSVQNYGYSLLLERLKDWESAEKRMHMAINQNPTNLSMQFELGKIYFKAGLYGKASKLLEKCSPRTDQDGTLCLARIQIKLGNLNKAKKTLKTLIKVNNDYKYA